MKDQIFSVGYRRLPSGGARRWAPWPIARTALDLAWRKRSTKFAVALCGMSVFGHAMALGVQLIAKRVMGQGGPKADAFRGVMSGVVGDVHATLATFIGVQMMAVALLLAVVGSGLIAEDRRTGAMELYFSRPLTRRDYVVGKVLAVALLPMAALVGPYILLWLLAIGTAPASSAGPMWGLLLPGIAGALVGTVLLTTTILGVSALGERGRTVGVVYFVGIMVLNSLGDGLPEAGYSWAGYLSPLRNVQTVVDAALGAGNSGLLLGLVTNRPEINGSALIALACIAALSAVGMGLLVWRVREDVAG